ncbi:type II toxin-antitoxin system RelE/ParE family toxin [Uruburuella testudinis]|uniref:Type II toxin-antitoxin system RelE/ParE family toxin n=1 Tax=Uruburuella testudinis TaxID=1282863 RepID=A0ABY4DS66_9NEIS|nr:type II toxin-antitoxin system RelE/ParE family toxin [Uruburuella testudinis]UOO81253.1 type II toxin-antitoxin system RelE/ParE family toxin [Uruburuella testudinis]
MTYELAFLPSARREWDKLDNSIKTLFKRRLAERLENPHMPSAALHGMRNAYKIKLRQAGYRLVYTVDDGLITVTVVAVGRRDKSTVYVQALARAKDK